MPEETQKPDEQISDETLPSEFEQNDDVDNVAESELDVTETEPSEPDIDASVEDALNLSIEGSTISVDILSEDDLASGVDIASDSDGDEIQASELNVSVEDTTILLETTTDDEEIVIKDFLNADDGAPEETPDYLKPATPEWKLHAQRLYEEREAKKRELFERRRQEDARVIAEREALEKERLESRKQQEAEFREHRSEHLQEKKTAVDNMIQQIREEREQKLVERAEFEEKEFGRKINYPKPTEAKPYPKSSESKRMEREQPISDKPPKTNDKPSSPTKDPKSDDIDSRVSRLSKPETSESEEDK